MTEIQALQIVEQLRQQCSLAGADHDKAREAVKTLAEFINKHQEVPAKEEDK